MNQDINVLSNGDFHVVVVEDGLTIYTEQEDPLFTALADAMEDGIGGA